jgi:HAE1 family hydrophobic/amphiphilic exporter-1
VLLSVQKSQGENTIAVVDGLTRGAGRMQPLLPPGIAAEINRDGSRPIRVGGQRARTLIEGAVLTVLIVFLFLNSWRSTVITGLTLPIALIGTFLFMYAVRLHDQHDHADGAEPVRGPADRRRHRGAREHRAPCADGQEPHDAALEGTQEIGLAVLATTLSIVAVFLPIGFMGGIIGKFFHEFGITIVAAVLISMFVSFTLDPMLSSVWHDPGIQHGSHLGQAGHAVRQDHRPRHRRFDRATDLAVRRLPGHPGAGRWCTSCQDRADGRGHLCRGHWS